MKFIPPWEKVSLMTAGGAESYAGRDDSAVTSSKSASTN
jgi:hypothetical protein